jgi:hypothetical protein
MVGSVLLNAYPPWIRARPSGNPNSMIAPGSRKYIATPERSSARTSREKRRKCGPCTWHVHGPPSVSFRNDSVVMPHTPALRRSNLERRQLAVPKCERILPSRSSMTVIRGHYSACVHRTRANLRTSHGKWSQKNPAFPVGTLNACASPAIGAQLTRRSTRTSRRSARLCRAGVPEGRPRIRLAPPRSWSRRAWTCQTND